MEVSSLHCIICPSQPRFSDVSHLLTHISSKAHLSFYFKLQVRSQQDKTSLGLLCQYDGWFQINNLGQLLAERINSKEDRKKKKRPQVKTTISQTDLGQHPASSTSRRSAAADAVPHSDTPLPHYLDPRLADSFEKMKQNLEGEDASFSCQVAPAPPVPAPAGACMVLANSTTRVTRSGNKTSLGGWLDDDAPLDRTGKIPLPVTPTPQRRMRNKPSQVIWAMDNGPADPFTDHQSPDETWDEADAVKKRADEMARLKGVLWPGMDIFDSATQQMRRRRNQRKDHTALKMMEMTSSLVEPAELIFSTSGTFLKQRVITGEVDENSPLKGETPIPKTRISRPRHSRSKRAALAQIDSNVRRGPRNKRTKRATRQDRNTPEEEAVQGRASAFALRNPFGGDRSDFEDDDDDLSLTMRAFAKRPRARFTIFADDDHEMGFSNGQSLQSKYTRDTLTPARLVRDNKSDMSTHRERKNDEPSLDKENIEPILNPQGRIDLSSWSNSPFLKRRNTQGFLLDGSPGMMFSHDEACDQRGYRPNPLFFPSSKIDFFDEDAYERKGSSVQTAVSRAVSSEATVSEEDHHELARLYLENTTD